MRGAHGRDTCPLPTHELVELPQVGAASPSPAAPEDREPASSELGLVELTAQVRPANLDDEVVQCRPEPVHKVAGHDAELWRGLIQKLPEDDLIAARIELARAG